MQKQKYEVRLSGTGGQGLLLAGIILGEAASIYDGKNAVQSQSYGPEARGGASKSDVIISKEKINYPKVKMADILLCLSNESFIKYSPMVKEEGILIVDSDFVKETKNYKGKKYELPLIRTAVEKVGRKIVANIVALGALTAITNVVSFDSLKKAVLNRAPKGTEEINLKALEEGFRIGEEVSKPKTETGKV